MANLEQKLQDAIWVGKVLFDRNKATGSSANLSFLHGDKVYITGSGTCFGNLTKDDFSVTDREGNHLSGIKASKELPLHLSLYNKDPGIQAVLHTHSYYSTVWSCLEHENQVDVIPDYTPYLRMKLGTVGMIPYAKPGSPELFKLFEERINDSDGYLLQNHGPVIGDKNIIAAFYVLEELEESARIAIELRKETNAQLIK
ncbi:class II aldolase/adducin family protein [Oceanobacillus alkalisoli]|uniref:class II aldolase/adducin family protein n=1 Tax=Oceanobacillus alkalisoli TaxID=2925113 RepID=UPI001EE417FD|nr:class II aldolase/adducin family protein [Oceanobacillus alkalisoli]MCG5102559.1 class II aldolase/adducin family protein [Oceanobacillus alkalisoli]